ncbi:serine-rich adhesin for platelets-like [Anopheles nili]|uniref:serine-rich adhesin for platelets-like n=1 Tax=Anopheles nili TaxID=185578 RepID=UPI00237A26CB|nr:serine-rich adhesin for platelets-like [Anopheles nili]
MEAIPVSEEQPEQPVDEKCSATDAVASTDCIDSGKETTEMSKPTTPVPMRLSEVLPQGGPSLSKECQEHDVSTESSIIDSSPEKEPSSTVKTKEGIFKSPEIEVFSIDDEEEQEEEDVDDEEEEEPEYDEMDEDEEIYVEEKDRTVVSESSDGAASKLDLSSDEYTDEDADERTSISQGAKIGPTTKRKASSDIEQDDDEVQIVTDDDDDEEGDSDLEDEDDEDDMLDEDQYDEDDELIEKITKRTHNGKHTEIKYFSDSSGSPPEKSPKLRVNYRSYQQKLAATLRKRTFKILNKRSMHVMEDSGDALMVCSDTKIVNLPTNLIPIFTSPKELDVPLTIHKLPPTSIKAEELDNKSCVSTSSSESLSTAKDTESEKGDSEVRASPFSSSSAESIEKSSSAISSTTSSVNVDEMPTATAVEVSEKIADSSDDAVSVLASSSTSSKKSITATTPTVNSSASTEPVEQKPSNEEGTNEATKASEAPREMSSAEDVADVSPSVAPSKTAELQQPQQTPVVTQSETCLKPETDVASTTEKQSSPSPTNIPEPTPDDVMAGIDDFMEQNGSEGDDGKNDFNEDLTFQMDVEETITNNISSSKNVKAEEGAIDLTSSCDQSKEEQEQNGNSQDKTNQRSSTMTAGTTGDGGLSIQDNGIFTSTPVIDQKKVQRKRPEGEQADNASTLPVKRELDEPEAITDVSADSGAQNLSKQKSTESASNVMSAQKPGRSEDAIPSTVNRKRKRSVMEDANEGATNVQAEAEPEEPVEPAKKLKLEVDANYQSHDRVVNEYIETTQNTSVDEIQNHTDGLVKEIQSLNDMIRETELKWNNLLHLKKVKEEILLRLNRRKHVIGIMDTQLGEVSVFSHLDSSNLSSQHHQQSGRSCSVGPRPPTPPPEVEIRPASVTNPMNYHGHNASNSQTTANGTAGGKSGSNYPHSLISNRRSSSNSGAGHSHTNVSSSSKRSTNAKDANSFVSQFNSSNNAVTMVPLPNTTSMILHARANMNSAEVAREKSVAAQIQRQILPKPILSNHQQILNNLAMSAGLTGSGGAGGSTTALLNGHHSPSASNSTGNSHHHQQQQLQIGRQGMRKDVSSIIADYRQKHPENVPRRGRRLKNVGGISNNGGLTTSSFGDGGAISLTALSGGKSPSMANTRPSSTDSVANRISELLAAAENSRPSSNDSSQSNSNLLSSLVSASGATNNNQQQFLKDVLAQFAKMSQNDQNLLSNLQLLAGSALASSVSASSATNTISSPQQSPQQHPSTGLHQQQSSLLSKASLPEVTLHPVMNSTAHSDILGGSSHGNGSLTGANLSAVNSSSNSLLHGILTKSASRPGSAAAAAAAAVGNLNNFSPTLARLLTGSERMNSQSSATVTSGALANLQTNSVASGGLNLSKNTNEISITPVVGSNFQQTLLAQQQQQHQQQQLQRLREQHMYKAESYLNLDDEADDSVDRLVIDEGDDLSQRDAGSLHGKRRGAEINENEVPQCQGCKKMEAKFVCAGCGNQWYCSRNCQVNAWDDHSETCNG